MYHQKRFADAELIFDPVYRAMKADPARDIDRYSMVIDFLAQSKSLQGKNAEVPPLMEERLAIAVSRHKGELHKTAPMQAGVAEAYFRDGRIEDAIRLVRQSISGLEQLGQGSADYLELARSNLAKYQNGPFDESEIPFDLSDFYSRCESISKGDSESIAKRKMDDFVELDVEYKPQGFLGMMFEMALSGKDGAARSGGHYRHIYLPGTDESLLRDLCVIDQKDGVVISADNTVE